MWRISRRKLQLVAITVLFTILIASRSRDLPSTRHRPEVTASPTSHCELRNLDPLDPVSRRHLSIAPDKELDCGEDMRSELVSGQLVIRAENSSRWDCHWRCLHLRDDNCLTGSEPRSIAESTAGCEFVKVYCLENDSLVFTDVHHVMKKQPMKSLKNNKSSKKGANQWNVLLLGLDATSRNNYLRYLTETSSYLNQTFRVFDFKGYTRVGENTLPNIVPLLTGKSLDDFGWTPNNWAGTFDSLPLIWKDYAARGYVTLYAEDAPTMSIFNYGRSGFDSPPTAHYNRVLALAREENGFSWTQDRRCYNGKAELELNLEYGETFLRLYRTEPTFAFVFLTRMTHESQDGAALADNMYKDFFSRLHTEGLLENTITILFSDHGVRFGDFSTTENGRHESNLPLLNIITPRHFTSRHPHAAQRLKEAEEVLLTPYDLHTTLQSILQSPELDESAGGLFGQSEERDCAAAKVPVEFCPCERYTSSVLSENVTLAAAMETEKFLNALINDNQLTECSTWRLAQVITATELERSAQFVSLRLLASYKAAEASEPTEGVFESILTLNLPGHALSKMSTPERRDEYGSGEGGCYTPRSLRHLCACKPLLELTEV